MLIMHVVVSSTDVFCLNFSHKISPTIIVTSEIFYVCSVFFIISSKHYNGAHLKTD